MSHMSRFSCIGMFGAGPHLLLPPEDCPDVEDILDNLLTL